MKHSDSSAKANRLLLSPQDSAGVRALVRRATSAQRLNRRFTLVSPHTPVRELLELSPLTNVLDIVDSR